MKEREGVLYILREKDNNSNNHKISESEKGRYSTIVTDNYCLKEGDCEREA
jgi:hypothetical protein